MIAVVTRSPTPELKLTSQQDTNTGARRRPFQEKLLFMIFHITLDGVESCEALGKGVLGLTGGSHCVVTLFSVPAITRQASLFVDLEKVVKCKEALIRILD